MRIQPLIIGLIIWATMRLGAHALFHWPYSWPALVMDLCGIVLIVGFNWWMGQVYPIGKDE